MREHETVVLNRDLPEHGLERGDVGTVVLVHGGGAGFEVEFVTLDGATIAVVSLGAADVRAVSASEVPHARKIAI
jgi:hypothetical protein